MISSRLYWIWFSLACGPGSRTAVRLLCAFGEPDEIYRASRKRLEEFFGGREGALLRRLADKDLSRAREILDVCSMHGIGILTPDDAQYPRSLYQLRDAPVLLYTLGTLPDFNNRCSCAVVGTRKMTEYGKAVAYDLGRGLAAGGAILVSGMALGNDSMAMAGALEKNGTVVGLFGCGVDIVYPPEHKDLMKRILENGCVLSEYPPGTPPVGSHFPVRNRLISGLSDGVVVVEGDRHSGALITARHALYQGRDVYAVPGHVGDPAAEGSNTLIKQGAQAVTSAADILRGYEFLYSHRVSASAADRECRKPGGRSAEEAAREMNVAARKGSEYYGGGRYGGNGEKNEDSSFPTGSGRTDTTAASAEKITIRKKKISPKKMVEQFRENNAVPAKPVIAAAHVELDHLGETEKKIYNALVPDVPVLADDIPVPDIPISAVLAGLTMLELCGAVECGAGGYYMRRSADDMPLPAPEE